MPMALAVWSVPVSDAILPRHDQKLRASRGYCQWSSRVASWRGGISQTDVKDVEHQNAVQ